MSWILSDLDKNIHIAYNEDSFNSYANKLEDKLRTLSSSEISEEEMSQITIRICLFLTAESEMVRAHSIKILRLLLLNKKWWRVFIKNRVDLYIIRSMDFYQVGLERIQAAMLIHKAIMEFSEEIPASLIACLAQNCGVYQAVNDPMTELSVSLLCLLVLKNIESVSKFDVFYIMIDLCLRVQVSIVSELVVNVLLHLLDDTERIVSISWELDMIRLLSPFTEPMVELTSVDSQYNLRDTKETCPIINSARIAMTSILRSWTGIILFSQSKHTFKSMFDNLPISDFEVQIQTLTLIYDVFHLELPDNFVNFESALMSINPYKKIMFTWSLKHDFIISEALCVTSSKCKDLDVLKLYHAFLLLTFFRSGIIKSLINTIYQSKDEVISILSTILLGYLLNMSDKLVLQKNSSMTQYIELLISLSDPEDKKYPHDSFQELLVPSSLMECLNTFYHWKNELILQSTFVQPFTKIILHQSFSVPKTNFSIGEWNTVQKTDPNPNDAENLNNLLKETLWEVNDFDWNWMAIASLLQSNILTLKCQEGSVGLKFIRVLFNYFKPTNNRFSTVSYRHFQTRNITVCAVLLFDFFNRQSEQPEGKNFIKEFISDFCAYFEPILGQKSRLSRKLSVSQTSSDKLDPGTKTFNIAATRSVEFRKKMSREYFCILRSLFQYQMSCEVIDESPLLSYFYSFCGVGAPIHILKLIIPSLHCYYHVFSRGIIARAMRNCETEIRLYATKYLKVLVRLDADACQSWVVPLLKNQLLDVEAIVVQQSLEILEEFTWNESHLPLLKSIHSILRFIGETGIPMLCRITARILEFDPDPQILSFAQTLLNLWNEKYTDLYSVWIDEILKECFSFDSSELGTSVFEIKYDDSSSILRSSGVKTHLKNLHLPIHYYSELASSKTGMKLLLKNNVLKNACDQLSEHVKTQSYSPLREFKSCIWSISAIGQHSIGMAILLKMSDTLSQFLDIAESCSIVSMRGVAMMALNRMKQTCEFRSFLNAHGWSYTMDNLYDDIAEPSSNSERINSISESAHLSDDMDSESTDLVFDPNEGSISEDIEVDNKSDFGSLQSSSLKQNVQIGFQSTSEEPDPIFSDLHDRNPKSRMDRMTSKSSLAFSIRSNTQNLKRTASSLITLGSKTLKEAKISRSESTKSPKHQSNDSIPNPDSSETSSPKTNRNLSLIKKSVNPTSPKLEIKSMNVNLSNDESEIDFSYSKPSSFVLQPSENITGVEHKYTQLQMTPKCSNLEAVSHLNISISSIYLESLGNPYQNRQQKCRQMLFPDDFSKVFQIKTKKTDSESNNSKSSQTDYKQDPNEKPDCAQCLRSEVLGINHKWMQIDDPSLCPIRNPLSFIQKSEPQINAIQNFGDSFLVKDYEILKFDRTKSREIRGFHSPLVVKNEVFRLACLLSSPLCASVVFKNLTLIYEMYPECFSDLCLYTRIVDYMSDCRMRVTSRRLIHELFTSSLTKINLALYRNDEDSL